MCEITIYIYIKTGTSKTSGRRQRPKSLNIPKPVVKFDCMHVPGRRQNIFLANVFGKISRYILSRNIFPFMSFFGIG